MALLRLLFSFGVCLKLPIDPKRPGRGSQLATLCFLPEVLPAPPLCPRPALPLPASAARGIWRSPYFFVSLSASPTPLGAPLMRAVLGFRS